MPRVKENYMHTAMHLRGESCDAVDSERAVELLRREPNIPGRLRLMFGNEHFADLYNVLLDDSLIELDRLYIDGTLTKEELMQFAFQGIDFYAAKALLCEVIQKMVRSPQCDYAKLGRGVVSGKRKEQLSALRENIRKIYDHLKTPFDAPVRNQLASYFVQSLITAFIIEIEKRMQERDFSRFDYDSFFRQLREMNYHLNQDRQGQCPSLFNIKEIQGIRSMKESPVFNEAFNHVFPPTEKVEARSSTEDFATIRELAEFRNIYLHSFKLDGAEVAIFGDEIDPPPRDHGALCNVIVQVGDEPPMEFKKDSESQNYLYPIGPNILHFSVRLFDGELQFIAADSVDFSEVLGQERYQGLKRVVHDLIWQYLEGKEDDRDDLLDEIVVHEAQSEIRLRVEDNFEEKDPEEKPKVEFDASSAIVTCDWKMDSNRFDNQVPEATRIERGRMERREMLNRLRGLNAGSVRRALRRLLGKEVRVTGSHYLFRSERTGATRPVPLNRDKRKVLPFYFVRNLEAWGVSLEEFLNEL